MNVVEKRNNKEKNRTYFPKKILKNELTGVNNEGRYIKNIFTTTLNCFIYVFGSKIVMAFNDIGEKKCKEHHPFRIFLNG